MEIKVAIFGFGIVGKSVYEILTEKSDLIQARTGKNIKVKAILEKDLSKKSLVDAFVNFTADAAAVLEDPEINVVIESLGGEFPAYDFIISALKNKKSVISSNKEVIAKHKEEFIMLAKENGVDFYFEASVGGSIPIIRSLKVGYAANQIKAIYGILNGTTNFILTKIEEENKEFAAVLKQAQDLGFAEANPAMDVSGLDAAYKLTILALVAFKKNIKIEDVSFEGIEKISLKDILYAQEFGCKIKLLAIGKREENDEYHFKVQPIMIPTTHALAAVRNEFNAIFIVGDEVGEAMLYGKGAGGRPTAAAIVSDLIDLVFNYPEISSRNLEVDVAVPKFVAKGNEKAQFYLRLIVDDHFGVLEKIAHAFGKNQVSLSKVIQKDIIQDAKEKDKAELVILTHKVKEALLSNALTDLLALPEILELASVIRVGLD
ncbi:MAG: homoserine dehydrogenase [Candidatus Margulisiibacteriota bacterium]|jgi:homoserine dehydrogenase